MLDKTDDISVGPTMCWCSSRNAGANEDGLSRALFHLDSHWLDVLALSWNIQTLKRHAILKVAADSFPLAAPRGFSIDPTAGRHEGDARRHHAIEAIFKFETAVCASAAILRLGSRMPTTAIR